MIRAAAIVVGSLLGLAVVWPFVRPEWRSEIALGLAGPLAAVAVSWVLIERAHRREPGQVTGVMLQAFLGKIVFFGLYVVGALELAGVEPVPFVVSFTTAFVVLYFVEAVLLQRLPARSAPPAPHA